MKYPTLALCLAFLITPAEAAGPKGCFERVYDAAYLSQNNVQQVDSIQVQLGMMPPDGQPDSEEDQDIVALTFRENPALFYFGISCKSNTCETDDSGRVRLETTASGIKLTVLKSFNAAQEGGGPLSGKLEADADSGIFALRKVSSGHCTYFYERRKGK